MKKMLQILCFLIISMLLSTGVALSSPFTNWSLTLDDGDNYLQVPSFLTVSGLGYVDNTLSEDPNINYTFEEWATFNTLANNHGDTIQDTFADHQLSSTFEATGVIKDNVLSFTSGTLDLYVNTPRMYNTTSDNFYGAAAGTHIASFNLDSGSGFVDPNDLEPAGSIDTQFTSTMLQEGYFFDPDGNDMATQYPVSWIFGLSNVTASYSENYDNDDFTQGLLNFSGLAETNNAPPGSFYFSTSGEFAVGAVPEPTTLLLFGTGLLGLAAFGRKKFMKKS